VDWDGNLIVVDSDNHRIRMITPQGQVSTLAGSGDNHRDGEQTVAQFDRPCGIAVDGSRNIIVADTWNMCIRKITPQGNVSTLAGTPNGDGGHRDGEGTAALFNYPRGIAVDGDSNVIVADTGNHRIRKITPQGQVTTLAGTGTIGHRDGERTAAQFNCPCGVAVDGDGNVIVADKFNHRIRVITPQGHVSTLAGTGEGGHRDGKGTFSQFYSPNGIAVDGDGNIIVADTNNHRIRKVTPQGHVSTLVGTGEGGHRDREGTATGVPVPSAQFNYPRGVAVDQNGNVFVGDTQNHCIRRVASDDVTPLAVLNQHYCSRGTQQRESVRKYLYDATKDVILASALTEEKDNNHDTGERCTRA
jgi:sugar lactone lactonase YvrE